ncbi:MAG TPA: hypothetical protein VNK52_10105 [Hyphomicrobiaceae bacterium]|nr:hypothetical protein [Hyphomicrobiaceae bacterium]
MIRLLWAAALTLVLAGIPAAISAQDGKSKSAATAVPKLGKDEKLCQHRFPNGEKRTWVCKKEQPCCAWDLIGYVKCGTTITGCL